MKTIALKGKKRIEWSRLRGRAAQKVNTAVKNGTLSHLKKIIIKCTDCPARATVYDHRDYAKPLEVDPVCKSCNIARGTNAPTLPIDKDIIHCPECESKQILYKKTTKTYWCRRCGKEWKAKRKRK